MKSNCAMSKATDDHCNGCKCKEKKNEGSLPMENDVKLYSASSVIDEYRYFREVKFHWVKKGPKLDGINYSNLIEDWDELNEIEQCQCEQHIDELFTHVECIFLEQYLKIKYNTDVFFEEVKIPLKAKLKGRKEIVLGPSIEDLEDDYVLDLTRNKPYELPFDVCAHFNLFSCYPGNELHPELKCDGVHFLKSVLEKVGFDAKKSFDELVSIVDQLYHENDMYVNYNPFKNWNSCDEKIELNNRSF